MAKIDSKKTKLFFLNESFTPFFSRTIEFGWKQAIPISDISIFLSKLWERNKLGRISNSTQNNSEFGQESQI